LLISLVTCAVSYWLYVAVDIRKKKRIDKRFIEPKMREI
jgi:hypothetical protein